MLKWQVINRHYLDIWEAKYLFIKVKDRPACLVCRADVAGFQYIGYWGLTATFSRFLNLAPNLIPLSQSCSINLNHDNKYCCHFYRFSLKNQDFPLRTASTCGSDKGILFWKPNSELPFPPLREIDVRWQTDDLLTWSRTEFGAGTVKCVSMRLPG